MEYTPRMLDAALTARSAAAAGMVLLKNVQNALPLTAEDGEALPVAVFGSGQIFTGKKIIRHGLLRHTCHVKTSQKILEFQTFTEFISFRGIEISDPCLLIGELDRTLCIDRCQRFT